jgi:hypothetical protein
MKEWILPPAPSEWSHMTDLRQLDWDSIPALSPFILADGSQEASQQTVLRLAYSSRVLYARFDCQDRDIWGYYTRRDDPIYEEEAVEVFIAPTAEDPVNYAEFEISPNGVLFDALIYNPDGKNNPRMQGDRQWDCPGIDWRAGRDDLGGHWWAIFAIPWHSLTTSKAIPKVWRANFYRIERPHDEEPEYSCWSPVMTRVADFHRPANFGVLRLP